MQEKFSAGTVSAKIDAVVETSEKQLMEGVWEYSFILSWDVEKAKAENDTLRFHIAKSIHNCRNRWTPGGGPSRKLDASWRHSVGESRLSAGAPVTCIFNTDDLNTYTFATSEILKRVTVNVGPNDGDIIDCEITLPMAQFNEADNYSFKILVDERRIPYYKVLDSVRIWWEETCDIDPMPVPKEARMPLYSTWYGYHYNVTDENIEAECKLAKEFGLDSIIVDDGWQIDKDPKGYSYCGDWEVVPSKIPDMKAHVARVHELGMKYILWFSVPFMGVYAKAYEHFMGKYLGEGRRDAKILDPRYPEVREYLADIYERFVIDYDLDGLKLDFVDQLSTPWNDCVKEGMDYICVQEATSALMTDVRNRLLKIKPNFMIEFRQSYIGPGMRRFGNMFRVGDCQNDSYTNHINMTDIRLISGNTAVHSDMLTWDASEPVEDSALQVLDCLFGAMQYSLIIGLQDEEHKKMSKFWIDFMKQHVELLQESEFIPYEPQNLYPVITARRGSEELTAVYTRDKILTVSEGAKHIYLVNATRNNVVWVKSDKPVSVSVTVKNCMGEVVGKEQICITDQPTRINVPTAGMAECIAVL